MNGVDRLAALDGLRGIASLVVVVFHFLSAFVVNIVPDQSDVVPFWVDTPVGILFNGPFAVSVFFVLSGFVLAHTPMARCSGKWLISSILFRYVRLAVPVTASTVLAWCLLAVDGAAARELAALSPSRWLQWTYQDPIPGFKFALWSGLIEVFWSGSSQFNNVLWTIQAEFIGSVGIYLFFYLVSRMRLVVGCVITLALFVLQAPAAYIGFAVGALLSLYHSGGRRLDGWIAWVALVIGVVLGSWARGFAHRHGVGESLDWRWMPGSSAGVLYPIGATLLLAAILNLQVLTDFFGGTFLNRLGAISFPLYLVHVPLIYTLVARAAVVRGDLFGWDIFGLFVFYGFVSLLSAKVMQTFFDAPLISIIRDMKSRLRANQSF